MKLTKENFTIYMVIPVFVTWTIGGSGSRTIPVNYTVTMRLQTVITKMGMTFLMMAIGNTVSKQITLYGFSEMYELIPF